MSAQRPPALVLLNGEACVGRGLRRWERVRPEVESRFSVTVVPLHQGAPWERALDEGLRRGTKVFIAAGGDGTVHALAGALVRAAGDIPLDTLTLGAVGTGSSNDFHKPASRVVHGIPLRIDLDRASPRDVARVRATRPDGTVADSVLVVSASAGVVAEGNALFNRRRASGASTGLTGLDIAAASLAAIRAHRPLAVRIESNGAWAEVSLSSLSVLETPWLSGALRYDLPAAPDDGLLHVAYCSEMGRLRLLSTLGALCRGRFRGRHGTRFFASPSLSISADRPFLLEVDGEVEPVVSATFDLLPGRLRACA